MEERCIACGDIIPEGRQVCPKCESIEEKLANIYPTYPCHRCSRKKKRTCRCLKWQSWFSSAWKVFHSHRTK